MKQFEEQDVELIKRVYEVSGNRAEAQEILANMFDVTERTIRNWASTLGIVKGGYDVQDPAKVLIYDLETTRVRSWVWWSGKQYIHGSQLIDEPKIITVSWKWFGEDTVHSLEWDINKGCDKKLVEEFVKVYNSADLVIGQNNDNFDNRFLSARALKHNININTFVRSLDLLKEAKRLFRLPDYSLAGLCKFLGVTMKQSHEGVSMWVKAQTGSPEERREATDNMIRYNIGDIISTEEVYMKFIPYISTKTHLGMLKGKSPTSCPRCGHEEVNLEKTTWTQAGTIQRIMRCDKCDTPFKLSNRKFLALVDSKIKNED